MSKFKVEKDEIWKKVEGYEDRYEVSTKGRLRSLQGKYKGHNSMRTLKSRIIKCHADPCGYIGANLHRDGVVKVVGLARLVAKAFIPNPDNKPEINHKNHIRDDNRVENLEWVTRLENMRHSRRHKKIDPRDTLIREHWQALRDKAIVDDGMGPIAMTDTGPRSTPRFVPSRLSIQELSFMAAAEKIYSTETLNSK